jgi:hypothetical protein
MHEIEVHPHKIELTHDSLLEGVHIGNQADDKLLSLRRLNDLRIAHDHGKLDEDDGVNQLQMRLNLQCRWWWWRLQ